MEHVLGEDARSNTAGKPMNVLLLGDQNDATPLSQACRSNGLPLSVSALSDAQDALALLRRNPRDYHITLIDPAVLGLDGMAFVAELRFDAALRMNLVFALVEDDDQRSHFAPYRNFVAGFVVKSKVGEQLKELVSLLPVGDSSHG